VPARTCRAIDGLHAPLRAAFPENVSPPRATRPLGDISQRSTAPAPSAPVGDSVPAMGPRLMACPGAGCGSCGSASDCTAAASTAGRAGRAPDLGAGGGRLAARCRGVVFFDPALVRPADGTFFGGFFAGIVIPSQVGDLASRRQYTGRTRCTTWTRLIENPHDHTSRAIQRSQAGKD
jgi:hypothetical protein